MEPHSLIRGEVISDKTEEENVLTVALHCGNQQPSLSAWTVMTLMISG